MDIVFFNGIGSRKMTFKKLLALGGMGLLLAACECATEESVTSSGEAGGQAVDTVTPGSHEDFLRSVPDRIHFAFDKSNIGPSELDTLKKQAEWAKKYPGIGLEIEGHCDVRGTSAYNLALGKRRANAARKALIKDGIPGEQITTISYGKERPFCTEGDTEECHQKNRVAVTKITAPVTKH